MMIYWVIYAALSIFVAMVYGAVVGYKMALESASYSMADLVDALNWLRGAIAVLVAVGLSMWSAGVK